LDSKVFDYLTLPYSTLPHQRRVTNLLKKLSLSNTLPHYDHKSLEKLLYSYGSQTPSFLCSDRLLKQLTGIQLFKKYLSCSNAFKCFIIVTTKAQRVPIISTQSRIRSGKVRQNTAVWCPSLLSRR
jgi:hypothetical protein